MAYEIKVQYQPSKAITAYVYGLVEGVMTQKAYIAQAGMPQVVEGSGLYANASDIADLAAGDVVIIHDVTAGDTIIGGGVYQPEISEMQINAIKADIAALNNIAVSDILAAISNGEDVRLDNLCARFLNKVTKDATEITVFEADEETTRFTQAWSSDSVGNESVGAATE